MFDLYTAQVAICSLLIGAWVSGVFLGIIFLLDRGFRSERAQDLAVRSTSVRRNRMRAPRSLFMKDQGSRLERRRAA
jgi:hypothetical protein